MLVVVVAWVPFRAESLDGTMQILVAMSGIQGFVLPEHYFGHLNKLAGLGDILLTNGLEFGDAGHFRGKKQVAFLILLILIAALLPNTQQLMRRYHPAFEIYHGEIRRLQCRWLEWHPTLRWAGLTIIILTLAILGLTRVSEFIYFLF